LKQDCHFGLFEKEQQKGSKIHHEHAAVFTVTHRAQIPQHNNRTFYMAKPHLLHYKFVSILTDGWAIIFE
jgi:hypothetical protein